jgi:hypothetical protein
MATHPGIRLKVETPAGVVLEGDSDFLHFAARWSHGIAEGEWQEVLQHMVDGQFLIKLYIQPVMLEDAPDVPDDLSEL